MKTLRLLLPVFLVLAFSQTAFSQRLLGGKVVEVIDGKTAVVEIQSSGRLTVVLQFIETPESEQPLHQTVKEHLKKLILDKYVQVLPQGISQARTVGQIFLGGVDVSQQMIRDGAAWYALPEKDGQNTAESAIYRNNELQAKSEKRGVWSNENLKPAWEFRAEKETYRKQQEKLEQEKIAREKAEKDAAEAQVSQKPVVKRRKKADFQMWNDSRFQITENTKNVGGLMIDYNPVIRVGFVATPQFKTEVLDKDNRQMVNIGVLYLYADDEKKGKQSSYLVGVESESTELKFLKSNDLVVFADNQKIVIGKAKRSARENLSSITEVLIYEVKRDVVEKVANAKTVEVKVGDYSGKLTDELLMLVKNLLQAAE